MEKVKRPKEVKKAEKGFLKPEYYQEYINAQLKIIYDKLDEIVTYINNN